MANWGLNVVKQYQRLVVFTFGSYTGTRGPGLRWLWPFVNNGTDTVDLREVPVPMARPSAAASEPAPA